MVLVQGAWAGASSWNGVIERLQGEGSTVYAVPNPLRGLSFDAAYVAGILKTILGPIILVGHSYGGAVVTNAGTGNPTLKLWSTLMPLSPTRVSHFCSWRQHRLHLARTNLALQAIPPPYSTLCRSPEILTCI